MKFHELTEELEKAYEEFYNSVDQETGEVDDEARKNLMDIKLAWNEKVIATAEFIKRIRADEEAYKAEIERMVKEKKALERKEEFLKDLLNANMVAAKVQKFEDVTCKISYRKSEKVEVENLDLLPEEFKVSVTTINPDKNAIKEAIKAGQEVNGAKVVECMNLQVK